MNLIGKLSSNPESLTITEKLIASVQVTLMGVSIVFIVLIMLYLLINLMTKVLHGAAVKPVEKKPITPAIVEETVIEEENMDETELIAVITAAVAASLHTTTHNIVVRNILRVEDNTPTWGKVGRINQIS